MARYWLGPWVWQSGGEEQPHWRAPALAVASLDLRSIPQCAASVTPAGFGLFVSPNAADLGSEYENLGTDPLAPWGSQGLARWQSALALPQKLTANTLRGVVWETLTLQADPIGDDRALPIVPTVARTYDLWIAGQLAQAKVFRLADPEATPLIDLLKRQYRAIRQASLDGLCRDKLGRVQLEHYRKVLGYWVRKFGVNYRHFQPADVPDESPLSPETTITESFNTADSGTLGPDLAWTEENSTYFSIVSDSAQYDGASQNRWARADTDLSSDDHYSQIVIVEGGTGGTIREAGVIARKDSSTTKTYYAGYVANSANVKLYKLVAGVLTQLGSTSAITFSTSDELILRCNGSTIELDYAGANEIGVTDTAITGNLRCGLGNFNSSSGTTVRPRGDNFEAADLAGGNRRRRVICGASA